MARVLPNKAHRKAETAPLVGTLYASVRVALRRKLGELRAQSTNRPPRWSAAASGAVGQPPLVGRYRQRCFRLAGIIAFAATARTPRFRTKGALALFRLRCSAGGCPSGRIFCGLYVAHANRSSVHSKRNWRGGSFQSSALVRWRGPFRKAGGPF